MDWPTALPAMGAAFAAALVEIAEAFTIILVVATLHLWRPALIGAFAALYLATELAAALVRNAVKRVA